MKNPLRQLDSSFSSFRLTSWGNLKLKIFAVDAEQQRRKIDQQTFAKIVANRSLLLFFKDISGNFMAEIHQTRAVIAVIFPRNASNRCDECVVASRNVFLGTTTLFAWSGTLFRVWSFVLNTCKLLHSNSIFFLSAGLISSTEVAVGKFHSLDKI